MTTLTSSLLVVPSLLENGEVEVATGASLQCGEVLRTAWLSEDYSSECSDRTGDSFIFLCMPGPCGLELQLSDTIIATD